MGLLGEIYSAGDSAKRKLKGLLSDPLGELGLLGARAAEDMQTFLDTGAKAYHVLDPRLKPRLDTPQGREMVVDQNVARQKFGEMAANMGMAAATVWHGSPHKFDRFDSSKIGTGEGAQAYGHGLYLADNPGVAQSYRNPAGNTAYTIDGKNAIDVAYADRTLSKPVRYLQDFKGDVKAATQSAIDDGRPEIAQQIQALAASGRMKPAPAGNLYKVDLPDEAIAKMLDWDKPLSQQAPEVQEAVKKSGLFDFENRKWGDGLGATPMFPNDADFTGEKLYRRITDREFQRAREVTSEARKRGERTTADVLRQAGIPGIRYLDGGSRGAGTGTRNYVVFPGNEGLLTILERNGVAP